MEKLEFDLSFDIRLRATIYYKWTLLNLQLGRAMKFKFRAMKFKFYTCVIQLQPLHCVITDVRFR